MRHAAPAPAKPFTHCVVCGIPLAPLYVGDGVCGELKCRGPELQRREAERQREYRERRQRIAREFVQRDQSSPVGEARLPIPPGSLVMVVPDGAAPLAPLSDERRAWFAQLLREEIERAIQIAADPQEQAELRARYDDRLTRDLATPLPVINACSTCRGHCCAEGETHAFLKAPFLAWRILTERLPDPYAMIADYEADLPPAAIENSCIYHTERGCALRASIRASMCHDFLCEGIRDVRKQIGATTPSVAISARGLIPRRYAVCPAEGQRMERDFGSETPMHTDPSPA